jgi:hypothetical protein
MVLEHLKTSVSKATLIEVHLLSGIDLFYQNFQAGLDYIFNGKTYSYAPVFYSGSQRTLELENTSASVILPNIPPINEYVWNNDGFRKAIVVVIQVFPDNPNASPIRDMLVVKSSRFEGAEISIDLQSPFSAVEAVFPSVYFRTGTGNGRIDIPGLVPEVPRSTQVQVQ